MNIPEKFDEIRPFEPEELQAVYDKLLADDMFKGVIKYVMPGVPFEQVVQMMRACDTNLKFQKTFCYSFLQNLLAKASTGIDFDTQKVDTSKRYTFISNHRDIVLDSAFLSKLLIDAGFTTTCEIAIGDNLLSLPWVRDLVRVNKSFIVQRSLTPRQMLVSSIRLSEYMHFAIEEKKENLWIAQREGRAKNSDDRTQTALLKMLSMGGTGSVVERLQQLHIVPLSISYEYDPCDYLKAAEMQMKRDNPSFKKTAHDDVVSMQTGIMGYKGRIHYHCGECVDDFLANIDPTTGKTEVYELLAKHMDQSIHSNYMMYAGNYVALDLYNNDDNNAHKYTAEEKMRFEKYLAGQLAKIDIPGKDEEFLRTKILEMYANPAKNYLNSK